MHESSPAVDGVTYRSGVYKISIIIEFFSDAACTDLLDSWDESDGMFTATYSTTNANESVMTIKMTVAGLQVINTNKPWSTPANPTAPSASGGRQRYLVICDRILYAG